VSLGRPAEAADAARRAIALSRERDGAWRALFSALQASGDQMSLRRSQREYRQVLDEMLA
jgi:two-component SAPR family response regulator